MVPFLKVLHLLLSKGMEVIDTKAAYEYGVLTVRADLNLCCMYDCVVSAWGS